MKALIYRKFGGPDVLEWTDSWPEPAVLPGTVLIRSKAGGINPKDVLLRKGKFSCTLARDPLPRISGLDIAGKVVDTGNGVSGFSSGDRVFGMTNRFCGGLHAEFALLNASEIAPAPSTISLIRAASLPLAAQTALQALRDCAGLIPGHRVLINGASGGVGHFAVQIARIMGADVHAVCGPDHQEFVASLGADHVHDYTKSPAPSLSTHFDTVFDVFGKYTKKAFKRQLGRRGIYVSTVPKPATFWGEFLSRTGISNQSRLVMVRSNRQDLDQIRDWVEKDQLTPHVEKVFPIAEAQDAHRHLESRHTTGKIVLSF